MTKKAGSFGIALSLSLIALGSARAAPAGATSAKTPDFRGLAERARSEGQVRAIVASRNGRIIYEFYRTEADKAEAFNLNSVAKSVTAIIAGIAIDEGRIPGDEAPISEYFPAVRKEGGAKAEIRLKHLLSMTSGLSWPESTAWNNFFRPMIESENWIDFILSRGMDAKPGAVFNYNSGNPHLVSKIVQDSTGIDMFEYGKARLFEPLGMKSVSWRFDPQGVCFGGAWVRMTARDALKLGQLILDEGMRGGKRIVSRDWIRKMTSVRSAGRRWNGYIGGEYGYGWWINEYRGRKTCFAWGASEQYVFVTPSLNQVAVFACDFRSATAARPPVLYAEYLAM